MARYDAAFWRRTVTSAPITVLMGTLYRLVENQEQKVTVSLVDDLDEHDLLEQLLEQSKPVMAPELDRFDYLLRAPWRYPPLPWGSRFGDRFQSSIFYGALGTEALLAEAAYYRLVFVDGMERPFSERVISQHTRFEASYRAEPALALADAPFARHERVLRDPCHYGPTQRLGSVLREAGIAAFSYLSARAKGRDANIALLSPQALRSRKHRNPTRGLCETRPDGVQFRFSGELQWYPREQFLVDGTLPAPA